MQFEKSVELIETARKLMPGGVNSPVRAFQAVGGDPIYIASAKGATLTDVDGNSYIDYVCSWGPLILGHSPTKVVATIQQAAMKGTSYGTPHEGEIALSKTIINMMPWIQMIRFVNSGTEASMSALRLARAATGRTKIIKFEGNYHGHVDYLLVQAGSGVATFGLPDSPGIPKEMSRHTLVARFNHLSDVESLFAEHGETIAAVIVEPIAGNIGVIPPTKGFLEGLRNITQQHGSLLIFDEVMTGFRVSQGGASELYKIQPDLVCLGKIIGGGLPVGAYGGRRDLMEQIAPLGPVYQAGTLSGNPLAMAAGLTTLKELAPDLYLSLEQFGEMLEEGIRQIINECGVAAHVNRVGSMFSIFFTENPVKDPQSALTTDRKLYGRLFRALIRRGIYPPPSALESWFLSACHGESEVEQTLSAFSPALQEALLE